MTDALTDALDDQKEDAAITMLNDVSLDTALDIRYFLAGFRLRNRDNGKKAVLEKVRYFLENEELDSLIFTLSGGYKCGVSVLSKEGFEKYAEHAQSCEKCSGHLSKHDLNPEKVMETIEKIKEEYPSYEW